MPEQLRLMAVHAHPDDESSKGAATMAKYLADGVDVMVATCTGGERGEVLNPKLDRPEIWADLPKIRRAEMDRARELIGFKQNWLGFIDSGMPAETLPEECFAAQPLTTASEPLVRLVRKFRPHVMITYDENGGYPHPDHIMCHKVSVEAFEAAGDPTRYLDSGEPWQPLKLYYNMAFSRRRILVFHNAFLESGKESPYENWVKNFDPDDETPDRVTTRVECAEYFPLRDEALKAHATQIDPDSSWFAVPYELQWRLWPTEDYELARSLVEATPPEDDLFIGVRDRAGVA